jgi:hypothetical protein
MRHGANTKAFAIGFKGAGSDAFVLQTRINESGLVRSDASRDLGSNK